MSEDKVFLPRVDIGSRWQFPGEDDVWVVGALLVDEMETTALCLLEGEPVNLATLYPAIVLAATAEPLPAQRPLTVRAKPQKPRE